MYLSDSRQAVQIDGCVSESMSLLCSVPQGSVLGQLVISIYSEPICDIAPKHDTDNTQLHLSLDVSDDVSECFKKMEECAG